MDAVRDEIKGWGTIRQVERPDAAVVGLHIFDGSESSDVVTIVFTLKPGDERKLLAAFEVNTMPFAVAAMEVAADLIGTTAVTMAAIVRGALADGEDVVSAVEKGFQRPSK